jgi:hypothetical protein
MLKWRRHMTMLALVIAVGTTIVPLRGTAEAALIIMPTGDPPHSRIGDPDTPPSGLPNREQIFGWMIIRLPNAFIIVPTLSLMPRSGSIAK